MKHIIFSAFIAALLTGCAISPKPVSVAVSGIPNAEIVVTDNAHDAVKFAGAELQHWIKEISGAELPIVNKHTGFTKAISLAVNPASPRFAEDIKAIGNTDGYAVRPCPCGGFVILGTRPKGILNGVYKVLFKNTDIIWARPHKELGTLFTPNRNLTFTDIDHRDVPVMVLRGWQMSRTVDQNTLWMVRNATNWGSATNTYSAETEKFDPVREFGGGHNIATRYISENKYYKDHPDFYPLVDGVRVRPSQFHARCQLCFTNKEMSKCFINEIDSQFKACPNYDTYRIMIEDNYILCNCEECLKPITCDDGSVITKDDPAFRSTQFFRWLNPIARHIKENYHKQVLTFAYFFTQIPPKCKVEDNISISFCPIRKNSKYDVLAYENAETKAHLDGWLANTPNVTWREYYGLCWAFPRPIDKVAAADWRYANSHGVTRTYSEMRGDIKNPENATSWDVNAMYFWVMTQSSWNPYQDVDDLRNTFLKRVYGPAADDVKKFYRIIEDSWNDLPGMSTYRDKARGNWFTYVADAGKTDDCLAALDAAAAKQLSPNGAKLLARLRDVFEKSTVFKPVPPMTVPKTEKAPAFDSKFTGGDWSKAAVSSDFFLIDGTSPLSQPTEVRMLHDDTALYVGILCHSKDFGKLKKKPATGKRDDWPAGEKIELFLTGIDDRGKPTAYQFVIAANGDIFDACGNNSKWNGEFKTNIDLRADGWSLMLTIPFKTLGYDEPPTSAKGGVMRYLQISKDKTTVGYLNNMAPHSIASLTKLTLE